MTRLRVWAARLLGFIRRRQFDADFQAELASHLSEAAEEFERQGLSPDDARRAAMRHFGSPASVTERHRDARSFLWVETVRRESRDAARGLIRRPGSAALVVLVLALGLGSVATVFALLDAVVLRALPYPDADRLVTITHDVPGLGIENAGLSSGLFFYYREQATSLASIGLYSDESLVNLRASPGTERVRVTRAGWEFFRALGVTPVLGRLFTEEDGRPGFMDARWTIPVLLTRRFWTDHFGSEPDVLGRRLTMNSSERIVVGVLPDLPFPNPDTQIWQLEEPPVGSGNLARRFGSNAVARLQSGFTPDAARAELQRLLPGIVGRYPDATPERLDEMRLSPNVQPLKDVMVADIAPLLWPLLAGMLLLLLIAAANAGGLLMVRAEHRRREMAVRLVLGAGRGHLARLHFTEGLMVTVSAAATGLLMAEGLLRLIVAVSPVAFPRSDQVGLAPATIWLSMAVAVGLAAVYAVLLMRRDRQMTSDGAARWATTRRRGAWSPDVLIVVQVALALTLLTGTALMLQTFRNLSRVDLGFGADHVLTVDVSVSYRTYPNVYRELAERVEALPGVQTASVVTDVPLGGAQYQFPVEAGAEPVVFRFFLPGYLETMQMASAEGSTIEPGEAVTGENPVLVSRSLARRLFPGRSALGQPVRRLEQDGSVVTLFDPAARALVAVPPFTIVGTVRDVREVSLRGPAAETVYIPMVTPAVERSIVPTDATLVMRTTVPPETIAELVRRTLSDSHPDVGVGRIRAMGAIVADARAREAFVGTLLLLAAGIALCLGATGIYGSVAEVVRRRRREIGIRVALGSDASAIVRLVSRGSLRSTIVGVALGTVIALASGRALGALLFGVSVADPLTIAAAIGVLLASSALAALGAAWRATRIAPLTALRED